MNYTWRPSREYLENSNVSRLMRILGAASANELRARSVADVGAFWDVVVKDLGIEFRVPYREVLDLARGIAYPEWFPGGGLNVADAVLGRWTRETPGALAVVHEAEDGTVRELTYEELSEQVARVSGGLRRYGIGKGDAVAIYLPMTPEAVVALYAVASVGAVAVPLFSGFAATAIASRIRDAGARAVITADGTVRRRRTVRMLPQVREALTECPGVELVVVVANLGELQEPGRDRELPWQQLLEAEVDAVAEATAASDILLLAYTSGTTGKPKGAVHTHAGFLVKTASEVAYGFDIAPGRVFCWVTDMGWIMGPLSIVGTHANGGALLLYEGSPDVPDAGRLWRLAERHRVSLLGVSPTLIRTLRAASPGVPDVDLSGVRVVGSTGEPWDPDSYEWLARDVFGGRAPVINFSGGTEVGGSFLCPYPVEDIRSCSLGGPALGMDVDVVDDSGHRLRGSVGELVCRQPWPAMTRGIWGDDDRYREAYWSTFPGMWRHGDYALADADGSWFILGRSDDVMNVAGKRVAPAEIESVIAADPAVAESAAVGIPDPVKGEAIWVCYVPRPAAEAEDDEAVEARLRLRVAEDLGKPFAPSRVVKVLQLPKTRSAKVLRRAVRAAVLDSDPGDLSGAENPEAVEQIRVLVRELG
jgi:acetyl-CoA synthetase